MALEVPPGGRELLGNSQNFDVGDGVDVDGDSDRMPAAAEDHSFHGADVVVVAAPGEKHVGVSRHLVIRGADVDPPLPRTEHREPGARGVDPDEGHMTWRWVRWPLAH